jgi:hypothetical protein
VGRTLLRFEGSVKVDRKVYDDGLLVKMLAGFIRDGKCYVQQEIVMCA